MLCADVPEVLIVAKCIVNLEISGAEILIRDVLIVAKCIVNEAGTARTSFPFAGINSSKVYCKSRRLCLSLSNEIRINSSKVYCK